MVSRNKRLVSRLGGLALVAGLAWAAALLGQELYGPVPSTIAYEHIYYDDPGSGGQGRREQSVYAVRSDGATCRAFRRQAPDGTEAVQREIRGPARGASVSVDEFTRSLVTLGLGPAEVRQLRRPRATCPRGVPDPSVTILGYATEHIRLEAACQGCAPGPDIVAERLDRWVSPELGCLPLRTERAWVTKDGRRLVRSIREAKAIVLGEPDPALFEIPDYPERTPSEVIRLFERQYGLPPLTRPYTDVEELDRRYHDSRRDLPPSKP